MLCYVTTIFCSRHDEIEISCPAPALCDGFGSSNAHHPVSLSYAGFHVTHISDCSSQTQFDFAKADYPRLMAHLRSVDWNSVLGSEDVDSKVSKFYGFLHECLPTFIPTRSQHRRHCRTRPWMSPSLARLRNRRRAATRRFKLSRSTDTNREFEYLNRRFNTQNECEYKAYVKDQDEKIRRDPKSFWKFVDEKNKCSSFMAEMSYQPRIGRGGKETSNLFAEPFMSTFSNNATFPNRALDFTIPSAATDESNLCLPFSEEDAIHVMRSLIRQKVLDPMASHRASER